MNSRLRCTNCRGYFLAEEMLSTRGMTNVCSEECMFELRDKRRPKQTEIRRNPSKPSARTKTRKKEATSIPVRVRKKVKRRDGNRCRWCHTYHAIHLHHVLYRSQGGRHVPENLICLCQTHHDLVHSNKKLYQPILLGLIWVGYTENRFPSGPTFLNELRRYDWYERN